MFEEHLSYLDQCHYTPITVTRFVKAITHSKDELPPRPIVITFDDAYADFYTNALPALQRHNFVATLYVPTAFISSTSRWLEPIGEGSRPMLTWLQLAEIRASGIECGAHSHTHQPLDMLPLSVAREEIVCSKEVLEEYLGQQVTTFAYPYGFYSASVRQIVQDAGYSSACAVRLTRSSLQDDLYALARIAIRLNTTVQALETALAGRGPLVSSSVQQACARIRQNARSMYGGIWSGWRAIYQGRLVRQ